MILADEEQNTIIKWKKKYNLATTPSNINSETLTTHTTTLFHSQYPLIPIRDKFKPLFSIQSN